MNTIKLRTATLDDAPRIQAIYAYYVLNSVATFEVKPPSIEEMKNRINTILTEGYPFIVVTSNNKIVGFSYAKMYYGRDGFKPTVENSIYVDNTMKGLKIGDLLLTELISQCKKMGLKHMIAYVGGGEANMASIHLHKKHGFQLIGVYKNIGYKLGGYHDMAGLQLSLTP